MLPLVQSGRPPGPGPIPTSRAVEGRKSENRWNSLTLTRRMNLFGVCRVISGGHLQPDGLAARYMNSDLGSQTFFQKTARRAWKADSDCRAARQDDVRNRPRKSNLRILIGLKFTGIWSCINDSVSRSPFSAVGAEIAKKEMNEFLSVECPFMRFS